MTRQKKNDYRPKNDELSFARTNTEPCEACCEFLGTVRETAWEGLSGKNAEAFLTEVGVAFHRSVGLRSCNSTAEKVPQLAFGSLQEIPGEPDRRTNAHQVCHFSHHAEDKLTVIRDLASYQETMSAFAVPALVDRFDMLRQLGNSFIVQPNVLKSYMTESHLGRIDARLLRPYLAQRSDYSQFSRSLQLDDGPIEGETHGSVLGSKSGLLKGSRLSAMSGVAGVGMSKLKEMLKDFDTLSPEEAALAAKREQEARARLAAHVGSRGGAPAARHQPMPVFYSMH